MSTPCCYRRDLLRERPIFHPEIGRVFERLRLDRGWRQSQAADIAKRRGLSLITRQVILRLERGQTKNVEPDVLRQIASLYETSYRHVLASWVEHRYGAQPSELARDEAPTTIEGFVALPLLADPIAAGQPLAIAPDPERDRTLSFREKVVRKFTRPICVRIGPREESMLPTLEPGDVIVIDQNHDRRRSPKAGHIYAVNFGPLTGDDGGAVKRIERSGSMLAIHSDNMNKREYPTQVFNVTDVNLLDAIKGEVVWTGRYLGSGKKADVRNMKHKRSSA